MDMRMGDLDERYADRDLLQPVIDAIFVNETD
jgi:hypothetical protein